MLLCPCASNRSRSGGKFPNGRAPISLLIQPFLKSLFEVHSKNVPFCKPGVACQKPFLVVGLETNPPGDVVVVSMPGPSPAPDVSHPRPKLKLRPASSSAPSKIRPVDVVKSNLKLVRRRDRWRCGKVSS